MKKLFFVSMIVIIFCTSAFSQLTVLSPAIKDNVKACADYADETLLDRWDMDKRTDLGWRIFNTVELPLSNLTNTTFQNGIFSADTTGSDPNITILDSGYPGSCFLGKIGTNFPINADKYTILVLRMSLELSQTQPWGQLFWSKNTIYPKSTTSGSFFVKNGWNIYYLNIPNLGVAAGSDTWDGDIDSLRIDPTLASGTNIKIDWIRLVENSALQERTIIWTGSGSVDIYLDNDSNAANGNLGLLAEDINGTNSFTFLAGGLHPGDYYVAIAPANTTTYSYSSGYYHINDVPIFSFTQPSAEGSTTDFITVATGDPWDMSNTADVEHTENLASSQFTAINYENLAGTPFFNQNVYKASSITGAGNGDPIVFFLHFLYRGATYRIDTTKYHNLVFKMGIDGTQSVVDGSIARVIWRNKNETVENVSEDIIIRHLPGRWVMNKIIVDMNTLPIEAGAGSPSHSGWNGELDSFRIDPHEFSETRQFFFDDIKLTADIKADTSYTIEWTLIDSDHTPSVSLYYDTNNSGYDGTLIAADIATTPGTGSYLADVSGISPGRYWLYAVVSDGINQNRAYASGPLFIDHGQTPAIALSSKNVNLAAEQNGPTTGKETIFVTNSGQGTLNWTAVPNSGWIDVNPGNGSGDGKFEIGIGDTTLTPGPYSGSVSINDTNASNSPQIIMVNMTIYGKGLDSPPFGVIDTPAEGSTVSGSLPVTGWALDDIGVTKVEIKREPDADDPAEAIGSDGLVYIGETVFVKGSRPDVEALNPNIPQNDRSGWGYMMLTYGLPRLGNGTFRLYAFAEDATGHRVLLGTKGFTSNNNSRVQPFGSIDTPSQGEVVSGNYVNFGWALTPPPKNIPSNGSTVWISMDGVYIGNADYNHFRQDIYDSFPGYANRNGAVGFLWIDTTTYTNGVHNIGWYAVDNLGSADGFGSRFFEIQNLGGSAGATRTMEALKYEEDLSGKLNIQIASPKKTEKIHTEVLSRLEIRLTGTGGKQYLGWGEDPTKALPIGSTLDQDKGIFYWSIGPGFLGRHVLHFAVTDGTFRSQPIQIVVHIVPKIFSFPREKKTPIK